MNNFNPSTFNALRFAELMQFEYGDKAIPSNECTVIADFLKPEFIENGVSARIPMTVYSPFLNEEIAKLFGAEKVRIGCDFFSKFLLFHYNFKPTFSVLGQELDSHSFGHNFFFELRDGHFTKRVPIHTVEHEDENRTPILYEILSHIYMPYLLLNLKIHEYRTASNEYNLGHKTVHKHAVLTQLQDNKAEHHFEAVVKDNDGVLSQPIVITAHSMGNALDILAFQYEELEVVELKKLD